MHKYTLSMLVILMVLFIFTGTVYAFDYQDNFLPCNHSPQIILDPVRFRLRTKTDKKFISLIAWRSRKQQLLRIGAVNEKVFYQVDLAGLPVTFKDKTIIFQCEAKSAILQATVGGRPLLDLSVSGPKGKTGQMRRFAISSSMLASIPMLQLTVKGSTSLFANHLGLCTISLPNINDRFYLYSGDSMQSPRSGGRGIAKARLSIMNRLYRKAKVTLHIRIEDYYGTKIQESKHAYTLAAGTRSKTLQVMRINPTTYKLRAWLESDDGQQSAEYWLWFDDGEVCGALSPTRHIIKLDKRWEYCWVPEDEGFALPVAKRTWKRIGPLPRICGARNIPHHRMWLRTRFHMKKLNVNQQAYLYLPEVFEKAEVFVDGVLMSSVNAWELPADIPLTRTPNPGPEHELLLGITDHIAARAPELPAVHDGDHMQTGMIAAYARGNQTMIGMNTFPQIRIMPAANIRAVMTNTYFAPEKHLRITTQLNRTAASRAYHLYHEIYLQGKAVMKTLRLDLKPEPTATGIITQNLNFSNAKEWNLGHPVLYELRSTLYDKNNKILDIKKTRFGFRETGIKGQRFTLNRKPFILYGASSSLRYSNLFYPRQPLLPRITRNGFHLPAYYQGYCLRRADEAGYLVTWEHSSFSASGGSGYHELLDPRLYANLFSQWQHEIAAHGNHPSIFIYNISNEVPTQNPKVARMFANLMQQIRRLAPNTLVTAGRTNDLNGLSDICNTYYFMAERCHPLDVKWFNQKQSTPKAVRVRFSHSRLESAGEPPRWEFWKANKPFLELEGLSVTDGHEWCPWYAGDDVYCRMLYDTATTHATRLSQEKLRRLMYLTYRQVGISGFLGHSAGRLGWWAFAPIAVFASSPVNRYFSTQNIEFPITVHNDAFDSRNVTLQWHWRNANNKLLAQGNLRVKLGPSSKTEIAIPLKLPHVKSARQFYLEITASAGNKHHLLRKVLTVFPQPQPLPGIANKVALYDPRNNCAALLSRLAPGYRQIKKISANRLDGIKLLIIGPNGLDSQVQAISEKLKQQVRNGLSIIVLEQQNLLPIFPRKIVDGEFTSMSLGTVIAAPHHAFVQDLRPEDFRFWRQKNESPLLHANAALLPRDPAVLPILRSGKTRDFQELIYSPLLEMKDGTGIWVCCQLRLDDNSINEPAAYILMRNMLKTLLKRKHPINTSSKIIGLLPDSDLASLLKTRLNFVTETFAIGKSRFLMTWDRELTTASPTLLSQLRQWVKNGGVLWLRTSSKTITSQLMHRYFSINAYATTFPATECYMRSRSTIFAGLSQYDWQWKLLRQPLAGRTSSEFDVGRITWQVSTPTTPPLLQPSYFIKVRLGDGAIVLDAIRWGSIPLTKANRIAGRLLANFGCMSRGRSNADRYIPASDTTCLPIPLTAIANIGFVDDTTAGNSKGGWTDEGAGHDLQGFPVGKNNFAGIPFVITAPKENQGNSIIAVRGYKWPKLPATSPEIKIGYKFDKLYLLHGSAWALIPDGSTMAEIKVFYTERKNWMPGKPEPFARIFIRKGVNIQDWWFMDKVETGELRVPAAKIGWRGKRNLMNTGVMVTEWNNPHPEKTVDAIQVISTTNKAQYFLLGVTTATYGRSTPTPIPVPISKRKKDSLPLDLPLFELRAGHFRIIYCNPSPLRVYRVYRNTGEPLLDDLGHLSLQLMTKNQDGAITHKMLWQQWDKRYNSSVNFALHNNTVSLTAGGKNQYFTWKQTITIAGSSLKITYRITPIIDLTEQNLGGTPSLFARFEFADTALDDSRKTIGQPGQMLYFTHQGSISAKFCAKWQWHKPGAGIWSSGKDLQIIPESPLPPWYKGKTYIITFTLET